MATPITVQIQHRLGRAEAQRRIESGFASLIRQLPGIGSVCSEKWDGDRLSFSVGAMGQAVTGVVIVLDDMVTMEINLPGLLGSMAAALKGRLQQAAQLLLTRK